MDNGPAVMDYRAGMSLYALAFLPGIVAVQQLVVLPDPGGRLFLLLSAAAASLVFFCIFSYKRAASTASARYWTYVLLLCSLLLVQLSGFLYATLFASLRLADRLQEDLVGQNIIVSGRISGLPVSGENAQRFNFDVESFRLLTPRQSNLPVATLVHPQQLRLNWYYGSEISAGERWQLEVRLKPPHGFINPGGFDYEGWLFQQGIDATGYVRKSAFNRRIQPARQFSIAHLRQSLSRQIDASGTPSMADGETGEMIIASSGMALVKALAIGDKSSLTVQQWQVLRNTGTSHLMAISGLHIGLAAFFAYISLRWLLPVYVMKRLPAQHLALLAGLTLALLYAMVAGLTIPTQRAIIMLSVLSLLMLMRRNSRPVDSLGLAMVAVLVFDPLAVMSAGFWFSFAAVAVIYLSIGSTQKTDRRWWSRLSGTVRQWLKLQLMISLFLLPLSLFMFQQGSLVSPLANLVLIPYVSFLVVPVVLLAILSSFLSVALSALLFQLAAMLLDFIWPLLNTLAALPYASWIKGDVDIFALLLASVAMLLIYLAPAILSFVDSSLPVMKLVTRPVFASMLFRMLASMLFIPILTSQQNLLPAGDFQVTVLDVGQGSAAVIRTKNHVAVFDSGARFSDSMDAGSSVVIPYLRSQGISRLDRLIISHGDLDHIGGAAMILESYPEAGLVGQDIDGLQPGATADGERQFCYDGLSWLWDGVSFQFLSPQPPTPGQQQSAAYGKRNNRSCVLRVSAAAGAVLFTGDIEKTVEHRLLESHRKQLPAAVLMVPHHGSKTSSSRAFIAAVKPEFAVISAGYENRYRLPSAQVTDAYAAMETQLFNTASSGAISISLLAAEGIVVHSHRQQAQRYWHHQF